MYTNFACFVTVLYLCYYGIAVDIDMMTVWSVAFIHSRMAKRTG